MCPFTKKIPYLLETFHSLLRVTLEWGRDAQRAWRDTYSTRKKPTKKLTSLEKLKCNGTKLACLDPTPHPKDRAFFLNVELPSRRMLSNLDLGNLRTKIKTRRVGHVKYFFVAANSVKL